MPTSDLVSIRAGILGGGRRRGRPRWETVFGASLVVATMVHAGVLFFWPRMEVLTESVSVHTLRTRVPELIELAALKEVSLPAPPGKVARPAAPITSASLIPASPAVADLPPIPRLDLDLDLPILDLPDLSDPITAKVPELPAAAIETGGGGSTAEAEWKGYEPFTPRMVRPEIRNRREVEAFLSRRYTPILRARGVTGVAQVIFWIDEKGLAQRAEIAVSSGSQVLDDLATGDLAKVLRFRPAMRNGEPVKVHVIVPIRFEAAML